MRSRSTSSTVTVAALAVGCLALTGCAGSGGDRVVRYSGAVEGGTISEVRYDFVDGANGAVSMPDNPGGSRWGTELDGGRGPRLVVTPSADGIARCALTAVASTKVLDSAVGEKGKPVVCEAVIAPD